MKAFLNNKPDDARELVASLLRSQPRNGYLHLLNALSYQLEASSQQSLDLAKVGYGAAVAFAPEYFWSHYLAGAVSMDLQNCDEAAERFSAAILDDPGRPEGYVGLAVSAYCAGELEIASAAADRAMALGPANPVATRTAAYIAASRGDRTRVDALMDHSGMVSASESNLEGDRDRLIQLVRASDLASVQDSLEQDIPGSHQPQEPTTPASGESTNQVMVEVALLLNQNSTASSTGINLLDGLTAQFATSLQTEQRVLTNTPKTIARTFTNAISMPAMTYSLNLFNTTSDYYRVVARPALVAYVNRESEFFIGRTVTVGVSGINIGLLQPIDVGTSVKLTPLSITSRSARFKVDVTRSFFGQETGGTFSQSLTTFKQMVGATAEVQFGTTLILSSLYEGVEVGGASKTPILGDIPILNWFFKARMKAERRDVALVLLTPTLPGAIETGTGEFGDETLKRLLHLWRDGVGPASDMDAIIDTLNDGRRGRKLHRGNVGDLRVPSTQDQAIVRTVVQETLERLR